MDSLDIRLLRGMFRGHIFTFEGVDPRISVQELSRYAQTSRLTVRRRLKRWRDEGFWKRLVAFPNPALLGTSFQMQGLILGAGRNRSRLEKAIDDLLEPAFSFQTEDFYNPVLLTEPAAVAEPRQRALEKVGVSQTVCAPVGFAFVAPEIRFGLRDWKIVLSLRRSAEPDWPRVAREVGVTVRGLQRRVAQLMAGNGLFFFPEIDFRRSPGTVATVGLLFRPGVDVSRVRRELTERYPDLLPIESIFPFEVFLGPSGPSPIGGSFIFFLPAPSGSSSDQLRRDFGSVEGVVEVIAGFPTQNTSTPHRFDALIQAALEQSAPVA